MFYAHTKEGCGEKDWQPLSEHLNNVAELCAKFSAEWCSEDFARNLGLLHDIGKYQKGFQDRLTGKSVKIEHAFCGAQECKNYNMDIAAYCIAGHHGGMPDIGTDGDRHDKITLLARLKRSADDYSEYHDEITPKKLDSVPMLIPRSKDVKLANKQIAFWIRMMFSSLVDADFLDTEQFCTGRGRSQPNADMGGMLSAVSERLAAFPCDTEVRRARRNLLEQAMSHAEEDAHIFTMNMPTGSGKTLASMCFALTQAKRLGLKRIIYVIPYTSIIEQNAKVFRDIFGEDAVLEHHCNFDYDAVEDADTARKLALAAENWDYPIIVTTNVQFFQSIYGNKPSATRKLHNIADSMIVFDEAHMFSLQFYKPCLEAIKFLVEDYGCRALMLSATMPDFKKWFNEFDCGGLKVCELITDKSVFPTFERYSVKELGDISMERLIEVATSSQSALIVVNTRKAAREIYKLLGGEKYHLSTYMTKRDRNRVIGQVRGALKEGRNFVLVSTSLIEAGVDLDFAAVFRERAGLDNVLQAAGRCNREGLRNKTDSHAYVFELTDEEFKYKGKSSKDEFTNRQDFCKEVMESMGTSPEAVRVYFDKVFTYAKVNMEANDFAKYITPFGFEFEKYAECFKLIDEDNSVNVVVIYPGDEEEQAIIKALKCGGRFAKRKLQQYVVSLRKDEYEKLCEQGVIDFHDGFNFLTNFNYYNTETGISTDDVTTYIF